MRLEWLSGQLDAARDGSVTLTGLTGKIRLPADYVTSDLQLGYAQTSHAAQGRTVDTSLLLIDGPTDSRSVYTPMTRGRTANHAYVVTEDDETGIDVLGLAVTREWVDQPAIARRNQLDPQRARELEPRHPGDEDIRERMPRSARQRIIERQEQRRRVERALGRGL